MNLELRREALEALGWKEGRPNTLRWLFDANGNEVTHDDGDDNANLWIDAPAIESDDGLALAELLKFCGDDKANFRIIGGCGLYQVEIDGVDDKNISASMEHTALAECICRAIIAASRVKAEKGD